MLSLKACEGSAVKNKNKTKYTQPRQKDLGKGLEVGTDDSQGSGKERMNKGCKAACPRLAQDRAAVQA